MMTGPEAVASASQPALSRRTVLAVAGLGVTTLAVATPRAHAETATAVVTDFGADPTGVKHSAAAFQACLDSLPNGGRVIVPSGTYLLAGEQVVELRSNLTIEGEEGATIVRREYAGSYCAFVGLSYGRQGRRSGVTNVTMRGLRFQGSFDDRAMICVMALHHCADIRIEDCEFIECQGGAGHTFDLAGCDDITFTHCTWRGYHTVDDIAPTLETIQLDISHSSTVSYPDLEGSYDAVATRNVTVEGCSFLPVDLDHRDDERRRDEIGPTDHGRWFPAPNPIGEHFSQDGQPYSGIVLRDTEIIDPAPDPRPADHQDNADPRGLIHIRQAQDVLVENVTVRSSTKAVSNRVLMFTSMSYGRLVSDANVPGSKGYYDTPVGCSGITVRGLVVEGFVADPEEEHDRNPIIHISGVDNGPAQNIAIAATIHGSAKAAVRLSKTRQVTLELVVDGAEIGVDVSDSTRLQIKGGSFTNVSSPIRLGSVTNFVVTDTTGTHQRIQPAVVSADADTHHGRIINTTWSGYASLIDGGREPIILRGNTHGPGRHG